MDRQDQDGYCQRGFHATLKRTMSATLGTVLIPTGKFRQYKGAKEIGTYTST